MRFYRWLKPPKTAKHKNKAMGLPGLAMGAAANADFAKLKYLKNNHLKTGTPLNKGAAWVRPN